MLDILFSAQGVFQMMLVFIRNVHMIKTIVLSSVANETCKIQILPDKC